MFIVGVSPLSIEHFKKKLNFFVWWLFVVKCNDERGGFPYKDTQRYEGC